MHTTTVQDSDDRAAHAWVQVALWVSYLGLFLRTLFPDDNLIRHAGRLMFDLATVTLIVASLPRVLSITQRRERQYNLTVLMLASGAMAGIVGMVRGNDIVRWTLLGFLPFMSSSVGLLGGCKGLFECLLRVTLRQLCVGVVFAAWVLLFQRPQTRMEWSGEFGDGLAKVACRSLYMVPFLIPYIGRFKRGYNALLAIAYLELVVLHIIGANRGPMVALLLVIPLVLFLSSLVSGEALLSLRRLAQVGLTLLLLLAPAINIVLARDPALLEYASSHVDEALQRMSGTSIDDDWITTSEGAIVTTGDEFLGNQSRGGELRDFWQQLEPVDFACGRGFGGGWMSNFWGGDWYMVHIGPAHLLLVGGVPLLLAFGMMMVGSILAAWRSLGTYPAAVGSLCYLLVFSMGFLQHGALTDDIEVIFYWMLTGLAFAAAPQAVPQARRRPAPGAYPKSLRQAQPAQ